MGSGAGVRLGPANRNQVAKQTYVYRKDKSGNLRAMRLTERTEHRPGESVDSFEQRMLKTFHQLECEQGSRFHIHGFNKEQIKRAWSTPAPAGV